MSFGSRLSRILEAARAESVAVSVSEAPIPPRPEIAPGSASMEKTFPGLLAAIGGQFPTQPFSDRFLWQYQMNVWAYRCTNVITSAGIRPEPSWAREKITRGARVVEPVEYDHPLARMLTSPNSFETIADIMEKIWISWELTGMWYLAIDTANVTLDHLRTDRVEIIPDRRKLVAAYRYTVDGAPIDLPPESVISGKYWNPRDDFYGLAPLEAAKNSILAHLRASKWNLSVFENSAMLVGYLKTKYDLSNDETELKKIRANWSELYEGYRKAGKFAVMGGDMDWVPLQLTHTEMGFNELLDKARDEIGSAFGVPNVFLNVREGMNYANSREHQRVLWYSKLMPDFVRLRATFSRGANASYPESGWRYRLNFNFLEIEALHDDQVQEAEASKVLVQSGQRTINEAKRARGEGPIDGGDVPMVPMSLVRLDQLGAVLDGAAATGEPGVTPAKGVIAKSILKTPSERRAHWERTKRIVLSQEARMRKLVLAISSAWREEMLSRLGEKSAGAKAGTPEEIVFNLDTARSMLRKLGKPIFEGTMRSGGERLLETIGSSLAFDLGDPRALDLLASREQRFLNRIGDANWQRVKDSLRDGIAAGENTRDLAKRVNDEMDRIDSNASMIARTEVLPCYHEGQLVGMKESGVVEGKEWLSAFAEFSRETHMAANGQGSDGSIGIDDPFDVGGEALAYPGDPGGSPSNIINCLCDVLPVLSGGNGEGA